MNLLNRKLLEKIKILDDIDKKYLPKEDNNKKSNNINNKINNNNKINDNVNTNSIELVHQKNKSNNEKFDKIYSDFILDPYKSFFLERIKSPERYKENGVENDSKSKASSKRSLSKSHSRSSIGKRVSNRFVPVRINVEDRLSSYGVFIENKKKLKRRIQEKEINNKMCPRITTKAEEIVRDPNKFGERLYSNYKRNIVKTSKKKKTNNSLATYNFSFRPELNKKSLLIANKLEPSYIRLNKKKKKINNSMDEREINENYLNLYGGRSKGKKLNVMNNFSPLNINNKTNKTSKKNKKDSDLYLRGLESMKKKEKQYNEKKLKEMEEYKKYSFKPKINKSKNNNIHSITKQKDIYKKNIEWKKKLQNENSKKKKKKEALYDKICTFSPNINKEIIQNDEKMIMRNLRQMNDYVNKRRKILRDKEEEENYKNKKLGLEATNFSIRPTIPIEYDFYTESKGRSYSSNRICENIEERKKSYSKKNENFFLSPNDSLFWFFTGGSLNYNISRSNNSSNKKNNSNNNNMNNTNSTNSHNEFIEAVNILHNRIDKLNI